MAAPCFDLPPDAWELFDISVAPTEEGLERYFERVLLHCERLFQASRVSLFLSHRGEAGFRLVASRGGATDIPADTTIEPGVGLAGGAIQRRASALIHVRSDERNVGSAMVVPLIAPHGEPLGVLNVGRRVTQPAFGHADLRHADTVARQLALAVGNARLYSEARQAEARLRVLLEAIPTAMYVLDDEGHITARNEAARAHPQHPPLDAVGRTELKGRAYWLSARDVPTGGRIVTVDDVTDREKATTEATQLRHLAEIGRMTATIAHEIRNPLTGIRSAAQMLREAPEHAAEWARIVEGEACRMEDLCEQFLAFARPMEIRFAPVDLAELALKVVSVLQPSFAEAGVGLLVDTPSVSHSVPADAPRIEQVLHNLLRNALQATSEGGRVLLSVAPNSFRVIDTGRGMTAEELENAGRPFFTTKTRGSGLGISTVRKIVEAHNGRLNMESELGRGTTVLVELPENHP
jgi:signal transduction histidine kinase